MPRTALVAGLVAALAIPSLAAPMSANARSYCEQRAHERKVGGTILGAVAGGLLGNAVASHGGKTGGTLLGAGAGAVIGNNLARTNCDRPRADYRSHTRAAYAADAGRYPAGRSACRLETRPYYDARGQLVYASTQVCG
jgi:uncharacterized protein YcfJ